MHRVAPAVIRLELDADAGEEVEARRRARLRTGTAPAVRRLFTKIACVLPGRLVQ